MLPHCLPTHGESVDAGGGECYAQEDRRRGCIKFRCLYKMRERGREGGREREKEGEREGSAVNLFLPISLFIIVQVHNQYSGSISFPTSI